MGSSTSQPQQHIITLGHTQSNVCSEQVKDQRAVASSIRVHLLRLCRALEGLQTACRIRLHTILKKPAVQLHTFSILLSGSMPSKLSCFRALSTDHAGLLQYYAKISASIVEVTRGALEVHPVIVTITDNMSPSRGRGRVPLDLYPVSPSAVTCLGLPSIANACSST